MKIATELITEELIKITPSQKSVYERNKDNYIEMLVDLDQDYQDSLYSCRHDTIIANHNAFSYLAKRYSFKVEALSGLSPDTQPSAKDIRRLMEHIREENVSVIFFESFVSDRVMKSIAKDLSVRVDVLQPLGNITADEAEKNLTYEDIMRDNLVKLHKALECR
jgi:zinc transport system substrate-binding protein